MLSLAYPILRDHTRNKLSRVSRDFVARDRRNRTLRTSCDESSFGPFINATRQRAAEYESRTHLLNRRNQSTINTPRATPSTVLEDISNHKFLIISSAVATLIMSGIIYSTYKKFYPSPIKRLEELILTFDESIEEHRQLAYHLLQVLENYLQNKLLESSEYDDRQQLISLLEYISILKSNQLNKELLENIIYNAHQLNL